MNHLETRRSRDRELRKQPLGSLFFLLVGYGLLVAAPAALRSLQALADQLADPVSVPPWAPVALAGGLALLGSAAMLMVLMRVVRDIEQAPYASVASCLGVLTAVVLIGLRAPLQIAAVEAHTLAILALLLSCAGGALAQRGGSFAAVFGYLVALTPAPAIVSGLWAREGFEPTLPALLSGLDARSRAFLAMLMLAGVLFMAVAVFSRRLAAVTRAAELTPNFARAPEGAHRPPAAWRTQTVEDAELTNWAAEPAPRSNASEPIPLTRRRVSSLGSRAEPPASTDALREMALAPTIQSPLTRRSQVMSAETAQEAAPTPERFSVWTYHDAPPTAADFEFPALRSPWRAVLLFTIPCVLIGAALAVFFSLKS